MACTMMTSSPFASGKAFADMPLPPLQARPVLSLQRQQGCVEHHAAFSFPTKGCQYSNLVLRVQPQRQRTAAFQKAFARMQQQGDDKGKSSSSNVQTALAPTQAAPLPSSPVSPLRARPQMVDRTPKLPNRFNRLTSSPKDRSPVRRTFSSGRLLASPSRSNLQRRTRSGTGLLF